jgi:hypothetical protein
MSSELSFKLFLNMAWKQGDQIGQFFANGAIFGGSL